MSDSIEDIKKHYRKNVSEQPRSIGLFTIPEYPELEADRGMWSAALDALLTTLRYLAPATLLTIFWGQQSFIFKLLKHVDSAFRAIVFSSEEQKDQVVQWLSESGTVKVEDLETVWRHGWILCGVLDAALPGACAGHPPTSLTLEHAQAIANHYLAVEPVFTRQELESNDTLSKHQEWKLIAYLDNVRQALSKLTPPTPKPTVQRISQETQVTHNTTLDYAAKGSGLSAAQVKNRAYFKIYPTSQQAMEPGEITILIRGPKDTYGLAVLPPILGKAQTIRQNLMGLQSKQNYTENILPITQGATYLRSYGKNDMNKTYYIPKTKYDIDIDAQIRTDHAKICYTVNSEGNYEVSITSRGQHIVGSPFSVTVSNNIVDILERDNYCLEDGEEIDIVDVKTDRKVVLRIVDFITEKMLLRENGVLEKISDEEAKKLMNTESIDKDKIITSNDSQPEYEEVKLHDLGVKFNTIAHKILTMNKICKVFNNIVIEKQMHLPKKRDIAPRNQQEIPDIVNSTLSDTNSKQYQSKPYVLSEKRDKYIVPENITVSLITEKSKHLDEEAKNNVGKGDAETMDPVEITNIYLSGNEYDIQQDEQDGTISVDRLTPISTTNPFLNEMYEDNYLDEKSFGTFVPSEYETNNCQIEETRNSSIKIVVDPHETSTFTQNNPFIDEITVDLKRPKSPIFQILSNQSLGNDEPVYNETKSEFGSRDDLSNAFVNPFFMQYNQKFDCEEPPVADFIIGAPVSLPPMIRTSSPEPPMKSLIITADTSLGTDQTNIHKTRLDISEQLDTTPIRPNLIPENIKTGITSSTELVSHGPISKDTNKTDDIDTSSTTDIHSDSQDASINTSESNFSTKRDTWDSAYVSIDDSNSSPDTNNNEQVSSEILRKESFGDINVASDLKRDEITIMGPAERELWQTCSDLKYDKNKSDEEVKPYKWEIKRPTFTPIIEESDRSLSAATKDLARADICTTEGENETLSVAFAELNDLYQEYFPGSEVISDNEAHKITTPMSTEESITRTTELNVDSASEIPDVKRHEDKLEGMTSEVQENVTESVSASQTLCNYTDREQAAPNVDQTQFGDSEHNIVLEKKKYWDEKIRQIEAKSAETATLCKKKRISYKQIKHNDSLSKRKGKQMIKHFLSSGDYSQVKNNTSDSDIKLNTVLSVNQQEESSHPDEKLVVKWKKYWDDKLETDHEVELTKPKFSKPTISSQLDNDTDNLKISSGNYDDIIINTIDSPTSNQQPIKQELPEEVFKAFETSPKRFFGTSRKRIMNKIDTFMGKPDIVDSATPEVSTVCHESGLVSSRISLFHNMSNTEELSWVKRKSQSLHNIYNKKDVEKRSDSEENHRLEHCRSTQPEILRNSEIIKDIHQMSSVQDLASSSIRDKRNKMLNNTHNISFDEGDHQKAVRKNISTIDTSNDIQADAPNIKQTIGPVKTEVLRRKSFSKSEMDIFNKNSYEPTDDLDKYKSCDELPKINVKSFISLYENVTKTAEESKPVKRVYRTESEDSQNLQQSVSPTYDAAHKKKATLQSTKQTSSSSIEFRETTPVMTPTKRLTQSDSVSNTSFDTLTSGSIDLENVSNDDNKHTTYVCLSDIELEIVECNSDISKETTPERTVNTAHIDYKSRFKSAKEYFQSLEELRESKTHKPRKLNECEMLLRKESTESLENERPKKRVKKNIKSHSMPSSEISKIWNQLQDTQETSNTKLVKISEKFNVDDLFTDVMEGRLSRQGSLRGIPHKKAVLEAFRSMENISGNTINSYEFAESGHIDFSKEPRAQSAQTYLNEYPYLPTTDPSKYHSRLDEKASGLISYKELLAKRPRRNSVPDLRLNTKFTEDL